MSTPFEFFRTPIQIRRFTQGFYFNGIWQDGSQIVLGGVLVTGNVISISLNGIPLTPITFTTNSLTTLGLIQSALAAQPGIYQVDLSGTNSLTITIVPELSLLTNVDYFLVTGGASQPFVTIFNSPFIFGATASVQPQGGRELIMLPEGRRDKESYIMFTSTEIYDLTTQNPDQITVLKGPFTGIVFETMRVDDWQNNSNFNITNHYKYVAFRLRNIE
jgi:hypothetical protein